MDLWRKSRIESEFKVVNAGDKVEAQTEAFPATPITLCKDASYFEATDDALDVETQAGQDAVSAFSLVRQQVMLASFGG